MPKKKTTLPKIISVEDPTTLPIEQQKDLVIALCELATDFKHPDFYPDDWEEIIQAMEWNPYDSDQGGDVYCTECPDCGKILNVKNLDNEGVFVPWCIDSFQSFVTEDVFQMFCADYGEKIGFIYCIVADHNKFIKIGYSTNPPKRLKALQTSCPHSLEIRSFFLGSKQEENETQSEFRELLTGAKNEWFVYDKKIIDLFQRKCPVSDCLMSIG